MWNRSGGAAVALYVTGNAGKHEEAQHIARLLRGEGALRLELVKVDLPELQGGAEEIAVAKTRAAAVDLAISINTDELCIRMMNC